MLKNVRVYVHAYKVKVRGYLGGMVNADGAYLAWSTPSMFNTCVKRVCGTISTRYSCVYHAVIIRLPR